MRLHTALEIVFSVKCLVANIAGNFSYHSSQDRTEHKQDASGRIVCGALGIGLQGILLSNCLEERD